MKRDFCNSTIRNDARRCKPGEKVDAHQPNVNCQSDERRIWPTDGCHIYTKRIAVTKPIAILTPKNGTFPISSKLAIN